MVGLVSIVEVSTWVEADVNDSSDTDLYKPSQSDLRHPLIPSHYI